MRGLRHSVQTKIISVWTVAAVIGMIATVTMEQHPVLGPVSLIALIALIFPGIPVAAIAMEKNR